MNVGDHGGAAPAPEGGEDSYSQSSSQWSGLPDESSVEHRLFEEHHRHHKEGAEASVDSLMDSNDLMMGMYDNDEEEEDTRIRVVRFQEDENNPDLLMISSRRSMLKRQSTGRNVLAGAGGAGLMMGLAGLDDGDNQGSAPVEPLDNDDEASMTFDIYNEGNKQQGSSSSFKDEDEDDIDDESIDSQAEQEKEIRKKIAFAVGGVAVMGLLGLGFKKVMSKLGKGGNDEAEAAAEMGAEVATDAVDDAATIATQLSADAAQASFNASAQASSGNLSFAAGGATGGGNTAATGAQAAVMQNSKSLMD